MKEGDDIILMIISYILELVQAGGAAFDQLGGSRGRAPESY